MEIKEVEHLLSVSRSNIRFYEKEGLIDPERSENNYRNYSRADIAMLKKIIVLRKLGCSVEEIAAMQKGEVTLSEVIEEDITRLQSEIERLSGALKTAKTIAAEQSTFDEFNEEYYWDAVTQSENDGGGFVDICKDCLGLELQIFDIMWRSVFFHNFKKSRKKYGIPIACGILLLICLLRGVSRVVLWHDSFWGGFLYPIIIFVIGSAVILPLYLLGKKAPKAAGIIVTILLILCVSFLAVICLYLLYGLISALFN